MAVLSGKNGTLYVGAGEVAPVSRWKLRIVGSHRAYTANDTGGWKKRTAGAKDCRGSFRVSVTESGNCPAGEGDSLTLKLHVDGTGNNYYEVEAIVDRIDVKTDVRGGDVVAFEVTFSGNGSVTPHGVLATVGA